LALDPAQTAVVVIDMQNYFLHPALGNSPTSAGIAAGEELLATLPAVRKAGVQVVWVNWGLSDEDLDIMPPLVHRCFTMNFNAPDGVISTAIRESAGKGLGDDMGSVTIGGKEVEVGRRLCKGAWNSRLYGALEESYQANRGGEKGDVVFDKDRISGFWKGEGAPVVKWLREKGLKTLLFTGVNTDQCVYTSLTDAADWGFDTVLLRDGVATTSPGYAKEMVEFNCRKVWGMVSDCKALRDAV
ncbi:Isochorismatase hydrolase, partial [Microthyrium microscopicum]